jgi:hypothetical protein
MCGHAQNGQIFSSNILAHEYKKERHQTHNTTFLSPTQSTLLFSPPINMMAATIDADI